MALRDRLIRPAAIAIPAIPAIPAILEAPKAEPAARIAKIATIASPQSSADAGEIRALLARQCPEDHPDYHNALRIALADPGATLEALREPAEAWSVEKRAELRRIAAELREALCR